MFYATYLRSASNPQRFCIHSLEQCNNKYPDVEQLGDIVRVGFPVFDRVTEFVDIVKPTD